MQYGILATTEELLLQSALGGSMESTPTPDQLTEEQQIELALKMSLADNDAMETETTPAAEAKPAVGVLRLYLWHPGCETRNTCISSFDRILQMTTQTH